MTGQPAQGVAPVYSLSREEGQDAGEYAITVTVAADDNPNYTVTVEGGKFEITRASLTITVNDQTYIYNGEIQGEGDTAYEDPAEIAEKVTVNGLADGDALMSINIDGQGKDVGKYDLVASNAAIGGDGAATDNYNITYVNGTLTIELKKVTITADDKTKVYDNNASTDPGLTAKVTGAEEGDEVKFTLSREEGQDAGDYIITVTAGDNPNYDVTVENGTFKITPLAVTVTITGNKNTGKVTYDGKSHSIGGYTVESSSDLYSEDDIVFSGDAAATGTNAGTYKMGLAPGMFTNGSGNFNVTFEVAEDGELVIDPAAVTVTAVNATKVEGEDDPEFTATATGLVGTDTVKYTLTRAAGETAGTYAITPSGDADQGNYTVTYVPGMFTITAAPAPVQPDEPVTPEPTPAPTPTPTPTPGRNVTPAAEETEEVEEPEVPLAPEPETEEIPEDEVPLAPEAEPEEIPEEDVPLAPAEDAPVVTWALINLIMMIVAIAAAVIAIVLALRKKDKSDSPNKAVKWMIVGICAAIAAAIAFFVTEDLSGVMNMTDQWTVLMVILGAVAVVFASITGKASGKEKAGE